MSEKSKELTFEKAAERLEEIVEVLESGTSSLDDSLALFEEGVKLSRLCNGKLEELERRIEMLTKEGGALKAVPFDEQDME